MRTLMPAISQGASSLALTEPATDSDINHVISIVEATATDNVTVAVWAKNVGGGAIPDVDTLRVEFGRESNPVPYAYGGAGCAAPCWSHDLGAAGVWAPDETLTVSIALDSALEPASLYRASVRGVRGGQSSVTLRANAGFATFTPLPSPTPTPTPTPPVCTAGDTGLLNASSEAADTGGEGNGWEVSAVEAFTDNAAWAINLAGTGDRHRYLTYGAAVPAGCAVTGIEVRLDWWVDSLVGTSSLSVELSWDGGATWTSALTDPTSTLIEHTALLGGPTVLWGHAWTPAELADANFRVRVTAGNTLGDRDFFLEWIPVRVHYGP